MASANTDAIAMQVEATNPVDDKHEENRPEESSTAALGTEAPAPSKKYMKRMEKRAKYEDVKKLKRKAEKERMKLKRLQAKENGTLMPITRKTLLKTVAPINFAAPSARVVVDMGFDQNMTTAEKVRTCKQLLRVYTLNRRAPRPMPVYFCGLKEGTEQMAIFKKNDGYQHWDVKITESSYLEEFAKERIVYLTSDSDNVLGELSNEDVYVIGGLVDHNRHKGMCHDGAMKEGIRHARLPIRENILIKCRTVLTIEQVFDMILRVYNGADWKSTLMEVVPKRKGAIALPRDDDEDDDAETVLSTTIISEAESASALITAEVEGDTKSETLVNDTEE